MKLDDRTIKDINRAFKSLEVWDDVINDIQIEMQHKIGGEAFEAGQYYAYKDCLCIIKDHLKGVIE